MNRRTRFAMLGGWRLRPGHVRPGAKPAPSYVEVISGIYAWTVPLSPRESVGDLRKRLKDRLNIPDDGMAVLEGQAVSEYVQPADGQMLTFVRHSGEMGGETRTTH